jgi:hypothetical protein
MPGGYVVRDANGQALAYIYSRENEDEARQAKVLTGIARLPDLFGKAESPGPTAAADASAAFRSPP